MEEGGGEIRGIRGTKMEEEGGEIRRFFSIEGFFQLKVSWNWEYLQILRDQAKEMLILENYNGACVFPFLCLAEALFSSYGNSDKN